MNNLTPFLSSKKLAVLTAASAVAFAGVSVSSSHVVGALQATPDEFVWSPSNDGPLYLIDGTTTSTVGDLVARLTIR